MQVVEFIPGGKVYNPPRLVSLGNLKDFVLGGPNPAGNDVADIEIDGSASN